MSSHISIKSFYYLTRCVLTFNSYLIIFYLAVHVKSELIIKMLFKCERETRECLCLNHVSRFRPTNENKFILIKFNQLQMIIFQSQIIYQNANE